MTGKPSAGARWSRERIGETARRSKVLLAVDVDRALALACRLKHGRFRAGCNPRGVPLRLRLGSASPVGKRPNSALPARTSTPPVPERTQSVAESDRQARDSMTAQSELPATASLWPLLGGAGIALLLLGSALTLRRRRQG